MFNIEELLNSSGFQTGLGLLGASSPKNAPLLTAYQLLQARKKAEQDALHEKTKMQMEQEKTRLYGSQVAAQERSIKQQEALQQFFQQYMQGGQGGMQPQSSQPPQMPTQPQMPQQPPAQPVVEKGRHGTPLAILANLEQVESGGNPYAIGPRVGNQNALGPYQFMPSTIKMLEQQGYKRFNPFNKEEARDAADFYLQTLVKQHGGDYNKALADYGGFKSKDPTSYVTRVLQGTPEKQAAQLQQVQAQQQLDGKVRQLQSVTPRYVPEFSMGSDGLKMNIKPNYEEQRLGMEGQRLNISQEELRVKQAEEARKQKESGMKLGEEKTKDWKSVSTANANLDLFAKKVDELNKHPGLNGIFGIPGAFPDVPGQAAADARTLHTSIVKQLAKEALQSIREGSPTGGALGNVSDADIKLLETSIVNLESAQSVPAARKAMAEVQKHMGRIRNLSIEGYERTHKENPINGLPVGARYAGIDSRTGKSYYRLPNGKFVIEE